MSTPPRRPIRRSFLTALALAGAVVAQAALIGFTDARPRPPALEIAALTAVGILTASVVVAVPIMCLGLVLLAFRATRNSGVVLSAYSAAYLCGTGIGVGVFVAIRGVGL